MAREDNNSMEQQSRTNDFLLLRCSFWRLGSSSCGAEIFQFFGLPLGMVDHFFRKVGQFRYIDAK
jgi:hypothetical protein